MKGILVIAHGSRARETEDVMETIISMVKAEMPETIIELAFMEFSERTIKKGVAVLIARGITEIKIVPYFLFMGIHLKEDIPNMISKCAVNFPGITITMGEPLGVDQRLANILMDRIKG